MLSKVKGLRERIEGKIVILVVDEPYIFEGISLKILEMQQL